MRLGVNFGGLFSAGLLEFIRLCFSPNLGSFQPLFLQLNPAPFSFFSPPRLHWHEGQAIGVLSRVAEAVVLFCSVLSLFLSVDKIDNFY